MREHRKIWLELIIAICVFDKAISIVLVQNGRSLNHLGHYAFTKGLRWGCDSVEASLRFASFGTLLIPQAQLGWCVRFCLREVCWNLTRGEISIRILLSSLQLGQMKFVRHVAAMFHHENSLQSILPLVFWSIVQNVSAVIRSFTASS